MPFLAPVGAAIAGVFASVGTFLASGTLLATVAKAAIGIGLNLVVSTIQGALARRNQSQPQGGTELDVRFGEDQDRIARCGRFGVAGHLVYANTYGSNNAFLQQVFVLSDWRTTSLDKVWIDGELVTLGAEDGDLGRVVASGEQNGLIWVKYHDGTQTAADAGLTANDNPDGRWASAAVGRGMSYVVCTMRYEREKLSSVPAFFFEGRGAPLYDWRKDSTVGGSGAHRWADPDTWEFSENPILMDYAYRRGISENGDLFCGMGMVASDLPIARYTVAANICDEAVSYGTRYRCAVGFNCNADHGDNIEAVMTACGGIVVNAIDGAYPIVGSDLTPVATLTDDDLIVGEQVNFQRLRPMNEVVNSVSGTFPNPDNQWSAAGYQRATDAATVTADRRSLDINLDFPTVAYAEQAAQLAAIYFSENRFEATATITVRPRWQVLEPGDWIVWNSARHGQRTFMVADLVYASLDSSGPRNVTLSLQERSGAIYAGIGVVTPPAVPVAPGAPTYQQELADFTVVASNVVGDAGAVQPAIRVSWTAPADTTVSGVRLQWRRKADPTVVYEQAIGSGVTLRVVSDGIVGLTEYEVRHVLATDPARPVSPSAWVTVTTDEAPAGDITVELENLGEDTYGVLQDMRADMDRVFNRQELLAGNVAIDLADEFIRREIVEKRTESTRARLIIEETIRALADMANAAAITGVEAKANDATAQALFRISASAGTGDVLVNMSWQLRASDGDAYEDMGIVAQIVTDGGAPPTLSSRIILSADKIVLTDGTNESLPFVFQSGALSLAVANIGTVTAGVLKDVDDKVVLNLNNKTLVFSD